MNFRKGYLGDYGVKLTPQKLRTLCEINWPSFGVGWPAEGALDKGKVIAKVSQVITGEPGHLDKFPYIDSWEAIVHPQPPWLRVCPEENCRALLAPALAPSQGQVKERKPVLPALGQTRLRSARLPGAYGPYNSRGPTY